MRVLTRRDGFGLVALVALAVLAALVGFAPERASAAEGDPKVPYYGQVDGKEFVINLDFSDPKQVRVNSGSIKGTYYLDQDLLGSLGGDFLIKFQDAPGSPAGTGEYFVSAEKKTVRVTLKFDDSKENGTYRGKKIDVTAKVK